MTVLYRIHIAVFNIELEVRDNKFSTVELVDAEGYNRIEKSFDDVKSAVLMYRDSIKACMGLVKLWNLDQDHLWTDRNSW